MAKKTQRHKRSPRNKKVSIKSSKKLKQILERDEEARRLVAYIETLI